MRSRILLTLAAVAMALASGRANLLKEVPAYGQDELANGQLVVKSIPVQGVPWPRLQLYQVINAPVSVTWSLLNDLNSAPSYTPGLISAQVISTNSDGSKDVRYTVRVPVIMRASYVVQNSYRQKGSDYEVAWKLLQSPLAKSSDGSIRLQPYGKNQTLMCYTNLCVPITNLLAGLQNQALNEAKTTVRAIKAEAERRAGNSN